MAPAAKAMEADKTLAPLWAAAVVVGGLVAVVVAATEVMVAEVAAVVTGTVVRVALLVAAVGAGPVGTGPVPWMMKGADQSVPMRREYQEEAKSAGRVTLRLTLLATEVPSRTTWVWWEISPVKRVTSKGVVTGVGFHFQATVTAAPAFQTVVVMGAVG